MTLALLAGANQYRTSIAVVRFFFFDMPSGNDDRGIFRPIASGASELAGVSTLPFIPCKNTRISDAVKFAIPSRWMQMWRYL